MKLSRNYRGEIPMKVTAFKVDHEVPANTFTLFSHYSTLRGFQIEYEYSFYCSTIIKDYSALQLSVSY